MKKILTIGKILKIDLFFFRFFYGLNDEDIFGVRFYLNCKVVDKERWDGFFFY